MWLWWEIPTRQENELNTHMKRLTSFIFAALLLAPLAALHAADVANLRCEYLSNPLGIDVAKPRLSWKIEVRDQKSEVGFLGGRRASVAAAVEPTALQKKESKRGIKQTAYQILVASSEKLLKEDKADLWDSGKVETNRSTQIDYGGKPLVSRQRCHWKVRVWTSQSEVRDQRSEVREKEECSRWSEASRWTMGLLQPAEPSSPGSAVASWQAKWITMTVADGLPHPWLRRVFELKADVTRAEIYVNTPSHYELYINGQKVGADVLAPAHVNLKKRFLYNIYEVSGLLRKGTNCIALWMGPGWYQPCYGNPYRAPIVRAQLEIESADGCQVIGSDQHWRVSDSCISQIGPWGWNDMGGERWDAARYLKDWNLVEFDDSGWAAAVVIPAPAVENSWQALQGSVLRAPIAAKKVYPHKDKWVIDFGTTLTGWMRLRMTALKPGQQVTIDYADLDKPDLAFHNKDGFQTFNQMDVYVAGSVTQDVFCSKFNQHAFRYAIISGLSQAPELSDAEAMTVETDLEKAGEFSCSNELFNRIHEVTVATYHTQIPCGVLGGGEAREKLGYGDGGSFLSGMLYNLQSDAFFQKWLRDWCDGQTANGFLGHTAPEYYPAGGGPSWGGQASELVRRLHLYFGDRRAVAGAYVTLKKYIDHLECNTTNDVLVYFNPYKPGEYVEWYFLGDWAPPGASGDKHGFVFETPEEREFFNNCYRVLLWDQLAGYAEVLGDKAEANRCNDRLAVLRPLIHKRYYDAEKQTYQVNRQAYLTIALLARVVPPELRADVFKQLVDDIVVAKKGHLDTGLQGSFMLLDLLTRENRPDLVALMMNQTTFPGWGYLLKERHVTSWPETWSGWGSQIIQVVGTPGAWFYEGLAGIQPDPTAPGFKKIIIKPAVVGDVTWVKCHHDSPYGRIVSNWKREGQKLTMEVTIPPNTIATVHVPAKDATGVTESNKPAAEADGVKFLRMEANAAVYAVGSGIYRFRSSLTETVK